MPHGPVRRIAPALAALLLSACAHTLPDPPRPGDWWVRLPVRRPEREFLVRLPGDYATGGDRPLLVALHGFFSSASGMDGWSGLPEVAAREGWILLYPQGLGGPLGFFRHWNSGHVHTRNWEEGVDDVGFVLAAIEDACRRLRIDRRRIAIVGHSNGGMMALRLAAEHPRIFACVVSISGTIGGLPNDAEPEWRVDGPRFPVPALFIHGDRDRIVPWAGGEPDRRRNGFTCLSHAESARHWAARNGCPPDPLVVPERNVVRRIWPGPAPVEAVTLQGWGHGWPGAGFRTPDLGSFEASEAIVAFVRRFERNEDPADSLLSAPPPGR